MHNMYLWYLCLNSWTNIKNWHWTLCIINNPNILISISMSWSRYIQHKVSLQITKYVIHIDANFCRRRTFFTSKVIWSEISFYHCHSYSIKFWWCIISCRRMYHVLVVIVKGIWCGILCILEWFKAVRPDVFFFEVLVV